MMMALAAGVILYVSFVMASLDRVIDDERFDRLRKVEISYVNSRGENWCYKLPESQILPSNIFYSVKELRDNLWIYFSRDEVNKMRVQLLMRDKKIEEVLLLKENGIDEKLINKQLEKISQLSEKLVNDFNRLDQNKPENKEIQKRMEIANEFYNFVYKKLENNEKIEKCYE